MSELEEDDPKDRRIASLMDDLGRAKASAARAWDWVAIVGVLGLVLLVAALQRCG